VSQATRRAASVSEFNSVKLSTFLLPDLIDCDLTDSCAVVIDVLRASTTMVHGFANGARRIWPCLSVDDARALKQNKPDLLLGGERNCELIPGFDLDNSPKSYGTERVKDQEVAFTTSNGTRAMLKSASSARVIVGAFANLASVVDHVAGFDSVNLVCAGTNGEITLEDCQFAGAVVTQLAAKFDCELNDASQLVGSQFQSVGENEAAVYECLIRSQGGRNLLKAGMESDIRICSRINTHTVVPVFDSESGTVRLAE
jgi:2-phosphosulfolactate phosphatase